MEKLLERYIVYSHKELAYIQDFNTYYRGGCDYTNNIYRAKQFDTESTAISSIEYAEEDFCEILKIYEINEECSEECSEE